jgi:hypothetical protein
LQCRLTLPGGDALLKFAQIGDVIGPDRKNDHENEQAQEGYPYPRFRLRI